MRKRSVVKKIGMGFVGVAMAGVMFFSGSLQGVQEVQADVRVFDRVTERFPASKDPALKILEITTSESENEHNTNGTKWKNNSYAELGYFIWGARGTEELYSATDVSYGGALTDPKYMDNNNRVGTDPNAAYVLYYLRNFGMIKPFGADNVGEYPIFAKDKPLFSDYLTNEVNLPLGGEGLVPYAKGVYSLGNGNYQLLDGYTLDDNHEICKVDYSESVSGNTIPEGESISVSENTILVGGPYEEDPDNPGYYRMKILTPVRDLDNSEPKLPTGTDGTQYITSVEAGTGNLSFERPERTLPDNIVQYYGISDTTIYYSSDQNVKFSNSDYIKEYVLGSKTKYSGSNIQYKVIGAKNVKVKDIEEADLIYISSSTQVNTYINYSSVADISDEVMMAIYEYEVNDHKAVIMDYKVYKGDLNGEHEAGERSNVWTLALLLWQESQNKAINEFPDDFDLEKDDTDAVTRIKLKDASISDELIASLQGSRMTGYNGNFVAGNVYVYNHHMDDFVSSRVMQDATDMICNGDFISSYVDDAAQQGFAPVLGYIDVTNKNSTTGQMLSTVTPAVVIQYILVSDGNPLTLLKNQLSVLEIQPVNEFLYNPSDNKNEEYGYLSNTYQKNRDAFVENYLGSYYDDKKDFISFTSMNVDEFNGHNEDLIETYDVIYIGAKIGHQFYTTSAKTKKSLDKSAGAFYSSSRTQNTTDKEIPCYIGKVDSSTVYKPEMYGNVYFTQADLFPTHESRLKHHQKDASGTLRFSSRDITTDKLKKLEAFLEDEHLILCDGDLMCAEKIATSTTTTDTSDKLLRVINPTSLVDYEDTTNWRSNSKKVDHGRMDNSSNMYELFQFANGYRYDYNAGKYSNSGETGGSTTSTTYDSYPNLISVKDIEYGVVEKSEVERYIMKQRLSLTMTQMPQPYDYNTIAGSPVIDNSTIKYLEQQPNGDRYLEYGFVINSDIANTTGGSTYTPHLYIDINNDGKFSTETEDIKDIEIREKSSGAEAPRDTDDPSVYALNKDVEYIVKRAVDKTYSGYLSWKITVDSKQVANVHASYEGATVAKNITGKDEVVKILQLNHNGTSTLNLQEQNADPNSKFGKYLKDVDGYDVYIKTIKVDDFEKDFANKYNAARALDNSLTPQKYAKTYFDAIEFVPRSTANPEGVYGASMLVLGFGDNYKTFDNTNSILAVQSYIEEGNPVLLTHDFIMFDSDTKQVSYLRGMVGMDKFGMTSNIVKDGTEYSLVNRAANPGVGADYLYTNALYARATDKKVFEAVEGTGKAVPYEPGSMRNNLSQYKQGFCNPIIGRFRDTNWKQNYIKFGANMIDTNGTGPNNNGPYNVDKLNNGQLTSFPYAIPDTFTVADTHCQYFDLDLDVDDDNDGESDTVVWYTFGKSNKSNTNMFRHDQGGVRPQEAYYIYNKGNVTYTGAGHSKVTDGSEAEAQLFVNTLFAAYKSKYVAPTTKFFETPDLNAPSVSNIPIPYDGNVTKPEAGAPGVDSSILKDTDDSYKYKFVDPNANAAYEAMGSKMYFRLSDTNFVRGDKRMDVKVFLQTSEMDKRVTVGSDGNLKLTDDSGNALKLNCSDGTTLNYQSITVNDAQKPVVDITSKINLYNTLSGGAFDSALSRTGDEFRGLLSGVTYGFYLPMYYLNNNATYTLYFQTKTHIYTVSAMTGKSTEIEVPAVGYEPLTVTKTSLLRLN